MPILWTNSLRLSSRVLLRLWDFYHDLRPSPKFCQKCSGAPTGSILEAILQVKKHSSATTQRKSKPEKKAVNNTQTPSRFMASGHSCQFQERKRIQNNQSCFGLRHTGPLRSQTTRASETYSPGRVYMLRQMRIRIITDNLVHGPLKREFWSLFSYASLLALFAHT